MPPVAVWTRAAAMCLLARSRRKGTHHARRHTRGYTTPPYLTDGPIQSSHDRRLANTQYALQMERGPPQTFLECARAFTSFLSKSVPSRGTGDGGATYKGTRHTEGADDDSEADAVHDDGQADGHELQSTQGAPKDGVPLREEKGKSRETSDSSTATPKKEDYAHGSAEDTRDRPLTDRPEAERGQSQRTERETEGRQFLPVRVVLRVVDKEVREVVTEEATGRVLAEKRKQLL